MGLLLDSAGIDTLESEVTVVERVAVEADIALTSSTAVDRPGRERHQRSPVPAIERNISDLRRFDHAIDLGTAAIKQFRRRADLNLLISLPKRQLDVRRAHLSDK